MVLPVIPIAIGLGGAALGGAGLMSFFSGGKKDETAGGGGNSVFPETAPFSVAAQTYAPHAPYETYSQAVQYAPVTSIQYPDYAINIGSPEAVASTKKEQTVTSRPKFDYEAEQGRATSGIDPIPIAIIAAVALVAYGLVSR